jgi:branched-chain amino acid transport system ATP-binding protein
MSSHDTLTADAVCKRFGGIAALNDARIRIGSGEIVGLIGRNGSGKSTLFNCMTGFLVPTSGRVELNGVPLAGLRPHRVVRHGVARTFQTPRLDLAAKVFDAVHAGFFLKNRSGLLASMIGWPSAHREQARLHAETRDLLDRLGLANAAGQEIGKLSMGRVRLVEVARSIAAGARFLLLDEPAAGLTPAEVAQLADQIRTVARSGIGVLLVEHNFPMIEALCSRVTVLEGGSVLFEGPASEARYNRAVIQSYLGASAVPQPAGALS